MFPLLDIVVMIEGTQVARAQANWSKEKLDALEWNASRHQDADTRATILYALASAAMAQIMTSVELKELQDLLWDLYEELDDAVK